MMRTMERVSYVITVYNKETALPFVLAGLKAQEGDFEREYIFVDDESRDASVEVVRRLTRDWDNVTIIEQKNAGPSAAMNVGFRLATGDWIKPMDSDDVLLPWATRRLMQACVETGFDVALAPNCGLYRFDEDVADFLSARRSEPRPVESCPDMLRRSLQYTQGNPSSWLARAERVRRSGGCDERVFVQDYSIVLRMAAFGGFARLAEPLFLGPEVMPDRMSADQAQVLHDLNRTLAHFLGEWPDVPRDLARLGFVRAAARAWAWARRRGGKSVASREFWLLCGARLGFLPPSPKNLGATCAPFAATNTIRIPTGHAVMQR
ncbi:MAG TPA: glycosyltransferase family 2 protein [Stellaceae bacterium]|nr:glycosyltransferase family 2 protein [Stellaceae bacterium]